MRLAALQNPFYERFPHLINLQYCNKLTVVDNKSSTPKRVSVTVTRSSF